MTADRACECIKAAHDRCNDSLWFRSTKPAQHPANGGCDVFVTYDREKCGPILCNDSGSWLPDERWSDHVEFLEVGKEKNDG